MNGFLCERPASREYVWKAAAHFLIAPRSKTASKTRMGPFNEVTNDQRGHKAPRGENNAAMQVTEGHSWVPATPSAARWWLDSLAIA